MDDELIALLNEVHRHGVAHDAGRADRLERLRNVEPDTARLLAVLIRAIRPPAVLEIGTSNGYSTLWLADAVRAISGRLVSTDIDPDRSAQAARNLDRAELRDLVELRVQDAAVTLRDASDAEWDMIFLDAERPAYASYWADLVRVLKPGGLLVVDNVISHAEEVANFRELIWADELVSEALVPTGAGALLVVREPSDQGVHEPDR
jgi:predicted O-methyltransferase YrrM